MPDSSETALHLRVLSLMNYGGHTREGVGYRNCGAGGIQAYRVSLAGVPIMGPNHRNHQKSGHGYEENKNTCSDRGLFR